jgi:hypothetical protein
MRRRELFAAALAAGLAAPAVARGQDRERAILRSLIAREEGAALAYRGLQIPGLDDAAKQDADHVKALQTELQALYSGAPALPSDKIDDAARRLREAATPTERRAAAIALETELLADYREAVLDLSEPAILKTVATIFACHAQRHALLSYPP